MRVAKSSYVGVLTRPYEAGGRKYLGIANFLFAPIGATPSLISEAALWPFFQSCRETGGAIDHGIPKSRAEYLVSGACYPPGGKATACACRVKLGQNEKVLAVFGNRAWIDGQASDAMPFESMPLLWERAFGGPRFPANPCGRGQVPDGTDPALHRLPNVEYLERRVQSPKDFPPPANFGPIDPSWPQRLQWAGTYDAQWLQTLYPGFPEDLSPQYHNRASADQQFEGFLAGDEAYELENLHPQQNLISGRLPRLRTRSFVTRGRDASGPIEDVPMRLTTVWFFPDAMRMILVFHGQAETLEDDASDIAHLLVAAETVDADKGIARYTGLRDARVDQKSAMYAALREEDLLPAGLSVDDGGLSQTVASLSPQGHQLNNLVRRQEREVEQARDLVRSHGLDPDKHAPVLRPAAPAPAIHDVPALAQRLTAEAEQLKARMLDDVARTDAELDELFRSLGKDYGQIRAERSQKPSGPPRLSARRELRGLTQDRDRLPVGSLARQELDNYLKDEKFRRLFSDAETQSRDAYRSTAQFQAPAPPMPPARAQRVRRRTEQRHRLGLSFRAADLTGADLSDLDLRGADFREALLESVNFDGSRLAGCDFSRAVLARASLRGADLSGCRLAAANLAGCRCESARFDRADLNGAIVSNAELASASFQDCVLDAADFSEAKFDATDWARCRAHRLVFLDMRLSGLRAIGADLSGAVFLKCALDGAEFSGAKLEGAVFSGCSGAARFEGAAMSRTCFVEGCDLSNAILDRADLRFANFRGARLAGVSLSAAVAIGADFSEAIMDAAVFERGDFREARFCRTSLQAANLRRTNLMNAVMQNALLHDTDMQQSNLFQADLARVSVRGRTSFSGSLAGRVRTYPRRAASADAP